MLTELYPLPLIGSILALVAWTFFNRQKLWPGLWQKLFYVCLGGYFVSLFFMPGNMDLKFGLLFRDMILLSASGVLFGLFVRSQAAFTTGLFFLLGGLIYAYQTDWFVKAPLPLKPAAIPSATTLDQDGELLVELGEHQPLSVLETALLPFDVNIERAFFPADEVATELDDYYLVDILNNDPGTIREIRHLLSRLRGIDWVEENETISLTPIPAKKSKIHPRFGIDDPGIEFLWGFEAMNVHQLYGYLRAENVQPKKKALIAILDTGVDAKHEDIKANYRSLRKKYDDDPRAHGTHCAGIAASVSNNGVGVASLSPGTGFVEVTSIKVLNSFGMGTQKSIIDGIIEAADRKADVISMSLGGRSTQPKQTAYKKAIQYALKKGAIVVAAAGNSKMDAKDYAPVNAKGVIGVSAIDADLNKADFSNYVQNIEMGLAAPGVNIYSTVPGNKYASFNGTSMATPYVSGLIGLMRSLDPGLTSKQAFRILHSTGKDTNTPRTTGQLIQPYEAVKVLLEEGSK